MKWINLMPAAIGAICLLASSALAQRGTTRYGKDIHGANTRGSEVTLYRDAARHASGHKSAYRMASHHAGHSSRYSHHGHHGHHPRYRYNHYPYYRPPVVIRPLVPPPVIVQPRYYGPQPYYYSRPGIGYSDRNFSIGIGF